MLARLIALFRKERTTVVDRAQRAAEQLMEDESLTDELDDAEAGRLLDWGIGLSGYLVRHIYRSGGADEAEAEERLDNQLGTLRRVMRKINKLVGSLPAAPPEMIAARLAEALGLAAQLPRVMVALPTDPLSAALNLRGLTPADALESILKQITLEESLDDQAKQFTTEE